MDTGNTTQSPVALLTGGGTGMGLETSKILAGMGYRLAITYAQRAADAMAGAGTLRTMGAAVSVHQVDIRVGSQVDALMDAVYEGHGRLDLLVNSAAATAWIPYPDLKAVTEQVWDEIMDVNVKGTWLVCRAAAMRMLETGGGSILNISSAAGLGVGGSSIPYAVSKAGVVHITKMLAVALAPRIRVNCVAPSMVPTRWWAGRDEAVQKYISGTRFKRPVKAEDVAKAVVALATNESISGQTLVVDLANFIH